MAVPQALLAYPPSREGHTGACSAISLNPSHSTRHGNSCPRPRRTFLPHSSISTPDTFQQQPQFLCSRSSHGDRNGRSSRFSRRCAVGRVRDGRLRSSNHIPLSGCSASSGEPLTEISVADGDQPSDEVADGIRPSRRQSFKAHVRKSNGESNGSGSSNKSGKEGSKKEAASSTQLSDQGGISVQGNLPIQGDCARVSSTDFAADGYYEAVLTSLSAKYPKKFVPFSDSYSIASENLQVLLNFADDSFLISEKQLLAIFHRFPSLLTAPLDPASVQRRLDLFHRYGVTRSAFFGLCSRSNILLFPEDTLAENLRYLRHDLGVVRIDKILKCFPLVLNLSLPNLEEKVRQLRLAGLSPVNEVLERSPFVLSARASEIQRKVQLVKRILGSSSNVEDPIYYLQKFPHVLLAQYETMERTFEGMVEYFGEEDTRRLLRRQPLLLGQNWSGMMDTLSRLIGVFGREGAVRIVNQTPTVMAYSWSTIQDKLLFVTEVMGRSIAEIVVWPALLTRSVEKRLRPRYELLRRLPREEQLSLGSMFGCTDEVFRKRYARKIALLAERDGGEKGGEETEGDGELEAEPDQR